MLGGEPLDVGRLAHRGELRDREPEPGQPLAHDELVLGVQQGVGPRVHGDPGVDARAQPLLGAQLVGEGDRRAPAGERAQGRGVVGGPDPDVRADQRGWVARRSGEYSQ